MLEAIVVERLIISRRLEDSPGGIAQPAQHRECLRPGTIGHNQMVARGCSDQHEWYAPLGERAADRRGEACEFWWQWCDEQDDAQPILPRISGWESVCQHAAEDEGGLERVINTGTKPFREESLRRRWRRATPVPEQGIFLLEQHWVEGSESRDQERGIGRHGAEGTRPRQARVYGSRGNCSARSTSR